MVFGFMCVFPLFHSHELFKKNYDLIQFRYDVQIRVYYICFTPAIN